MKKGKFSISTQEEKEMLARFTKWIHWLRVQQRQNILKKLRKKFPQYCLTELIIFGDNLKDIDD